MEPITTPNTPAVQEKPSLGYKLKMFFTMKNILILVFIGVITVGTVYYVTKGEGEVYKGFGIIQIGEEAKEGAVGALITEEREQPATVEAEPVVTQEPVRVEAEPLATIEPIKAEIDMPPPVPDQTQPSAEGTREEGARGETLVAVAEDSSRKCAEYKQTLSNLYNNTIAKATEYDDRMKSALSSFNAVYDSHGECSFGSDSEVSRWHSDVQGKTKVMIAIVAKEIGDKVKDTIEVAKEIAEEGGAVGIAITDEESEDAQKETFVAIGEESEAVDCKAEMAALRNLIEAKDKRGAQLKHDKTPCAISEDLESAYQKLIKGEEETSGAGSGATNALCLSSLPNELAAIKDSFDLTPTAEKITKFEEKLRQYPFICSDYKTFTSYLAEMKAKLASGDSKPPLDNTAECNRIKSELDVLKSVFDSEPSQGGLDAYQNKFSSIHANCDFLSTYREYIAGMQGHISQLKAQQTTCQTEIGVLVRFLAEGNKTQAQAQHTKIKGLITPCEIDSAIESQFSALMAGSGNETGGGETGGSTTTNCDQKINNLVGLINIAMNTTTDINFSNTASIYNNVNLECQIPEYIKSYYQSLQSKMAEIETGPGGPGAGTGGTDVGEPIEKTAKTSKVTTTAAGSGLIGFGEAEEEPIYKIGGKLPAWGEEGEWQEGEQPAGAEAGQIPAKTGGMLKNLSASTLYGVKTSASSAKKSAATGPEALLYLIFMAGSYGAARFIKNKKQK